MFGYTYGHSLVNISKSQAKVGKMHKIMLVSGDSHRGNGSVEAGNRFPAAAARNSHAKASSPIRAGRYRSDAHRVVRDAEPTVTPNSVGPTFTSSNFRRGRGRGSGTRARGRGRRGIGSGGNAQDRGRGVMAVSNCARMVSDVPPSGCPGRPTTEVHYSRTGRPNIVQPAPRSSNLNC